MVQLQSWNFYYLEFMYFSQDEWISDTMKLLKNITQRKNVIKACGFFCDNWKHSVPDIVELYAYYSYCFFSFGLWTPQKIFILVT